MINTLFLPELRELLAENNNTELREFCDALHPARTADFMEGLTSEEAWAVLQRSDLANRIEIFSYFDRFVGTFIIENGYLNCGKHFFIMKDGAFYHECFIVTI